MLDKIPSALITLLSHPHTTGSDQVDEALGQLVVVSQPAGFRRYTYLLALACGEYIVVYIDYWTGYKLHVYIFTVFYYTAGIRLVHYSWVVDSVKEGAVMDTAGYLLPSGIIHCTILCIHTP